MKKIIAIILTLAVAVTASACFMAEEAPQESEIQTTTEATVDTEKLLALYGEPTELTNDMVPETYQAEVCENISINAEVSVPDDFSFGKLTVNETDFPDEEKIRDLFLSDIRKRDTADNLVYYYGEDGAQLTIRRQQEYSAGCIFYHSGYDFIGRGIADTESEGYNSYRHFVWGANIIIDPTAKNFFGKAEIDGLNREDAIAIMREKIDALGIECETEPEIFVIDSEGVAAYRKNYKEQHPTFTLDETEFTSEDDAYFIIFNLACDKMPISYEYWMNYNNMTFFDSAYIYGTVSRKGLLEFTANTGFTVTEKTEENLKLYNIDIVEKALKNRFELIPPTYPCEITSIKLEYVCTSGETENGENLVLEPCWVCIYNCEIKDQWVEMTNTAVIYIKAATGELMETGGLPN